MTEKTESLWELLATMRRFFANGLNQEQDIAEETERVLSVLPRRGAASMHFDLLSAKPPPFREWILSAARQAGMEWEKNLAPLADILPWRFSYAPRADYPELGNRMGWAEIVGPAAPVRSDSVGFGLTMIGPDTFYPPHNHPAAELYAVVSGVSEWSLGGEEKQRSPGSFILHPSGETHAMRTVKEPLLAIYSWSGDILSPTVYAD